mgnify:FL=1|tara:strand:- start:934 stop:1254 length:321 start_codon:yes stop_codon:yes gene_type:complete
MGFLKRPKAPEPTAQEIAVVERQSRRLDEEIEEQEKRLKALTRNRLGISSLLAPGTQTSTTSRGKRQGGRLMGARTGRGSGMMTGVSSGTYVASDMARTSNTQKQV